MKQHYDFCIIGAGAGGLVVASVAAQLGLRVALIEKSKMGGDCLNYGCIPSKALLSAAKHADSCRHLDKYGIENTTPKIDYQKISDYVHSVINKIAPHDSVERFEKLGVTVIKGSAEFLSKKTICVDNQTISAKYFIIATGSRAAIPPIPGLDKTSYLTNETIFDLTEQPKHLLIIGAGPIGIEMAQAHLMLGTPVTVLDMGTMLPKDDLDAVNIVKNKLIAQGLTLLESIKIDLIEQVNTAIVIHYELDGKKKQIEGSHLLVAAGRIPNIDKLNLEKAGIEYDRAITVDKRLRTTNKHIYAIGDVTGGFQFTHIAGYQAGIVIRNTLFKIPTKVNYQTLPWVTYTAPELAQVGLNEAMAQQQNIDYKTTTMPLEEIDRFQTENNTEGFIKILTNKRGYVIGVTAVGIDAGELILMWSLIIQNKIKLSKVASLIPPYPTRSEISKRVAGRYFEPTLFSRRTRVIIKWLFRFT